MNYLSQHALCILCLSATFAGCGQVDPNYPANFPRAAINHIDGGRRNIDDYRGKVIVINFWASWCAPCRREMPGLQRLAEQLPAENFSVLGVSIDEDRFLAQEFLRRHRIYFDNFHDPARNLAESQLAINAYPQTLVLSPQGVIVARINGERNWDDPQMRATLEGIAKRTSN